MNFKPMKRTNLLFEYPNKYNNQKYWATVSIAKFMQLIVLVICCIRSVVDHLTPSHLF